MGGMSDQFWFNMSTSTVEVGRRSDHSQLLGPYPTREEAQAALETAAARTEAWDAEEE